MTSRLLRKKYNVDRAILRLPSSSNIAIHLISLNWIPVNVRSTYYIGCLCYHCHGGTALSYVSDMLQKRPSHPRNTRSCSYNMSLLNRPACSEATVGDFSFSFASSPVWNSTPNSSNISDIPTNHTCATSLSSFYF